MNRGVILKFKYHKSYRGFYLLEDSKFKRPYQKLDEEATVLNVGKNIEFKQDEIIEIEDKFVVFSEKGKTKSVEKKTTKKKNSKKEEGITVVDFNKLQLKYQIPKLLLENLFETISLGRKSPEKELLSVLSVVENVTKTDGLFFSKVKKIFYYSKNELDSVLVRYKFNNLNIEVLKKEIELNYPTQYISNLPLDYKEYEMIFVFYFIILVELLSILK